MDVKLDHKEGWAPKNWCFWTVVLEKMLESSLDSKEIKPVHLKGNTPWIFIGRTDAEAEDPIFWPPDVKSWLIGKDLDAGKDWRWEKGMTEDEVVGWYYWLNEHEFEQTLWDSEGQGSLLLLSRFNCVWLFVTPWTVACQASLSFTISWSLFKLMFIESVMPSSHLILCHPLFLQNPIPSGSFPMSQLFTWGGQRFGVSASTSVLPMNTQDWSPLGWTGWISLQSKGLSRVFSNTTVEKHQFFGTQLSLWSNSYIHTWLLE